MPRFPVGLIKRLRIGQERPVHVHVLVSSTTDPDLEYTVEQKLDEMIERKQELLKDYLYASRAGRITEEDLANELNINNPGLSLADIDKLAPLIDLKKLSSLSDDYVITRTDFENMAE